MSLVRLVINGVHRVNYNLTMQQGIPNSFSQMFYQKLFPLLVFLQNITGGVFLITCDMLCYASWD